MWSIFDAVVTETWWNYFVDHSVQIDQTDLLLSKRMHSSKKQQNRDESCTRHIHSSQCA